MSLFDYFFPFRLSDEKTIYTSNQINTINKAVKKGEKRRKKSEKNCSKMSLWKAHLKYWDGTLIPPIPTRLLTRNLCCQSGGKTWIIYQRSPLGTSWRTGGLKFRGNFMKLREVFFQLAGGRMNFARPRRTKSTRGNFHIFDAPFFQKKLKIASLAMMLSCSERCQDDTIAHWCLWQCHSTIQPDSNKHAGQ